MSDVAAADVEQPGDRIQHGQQHGVDVLVLQQRLHVADLVVWRSCPHIRPRAARSPPPTASAGPARRHRSGLVSTGVSLMPALPRRLGQPFDLLDGVQRRVVADRGALAELLGDPARRLGVGRLQHLEQGGVGLRARLQRVAPVDEQRRCLLQHDGHAGRSGEAGEPGQPLGGTGPGTRPDARRYAERESP